SLTDQVSSGLASLALASSWNFQPVKSLPLKSGLNPSSSFLSSAAVAKRAATASTATQSSRRRRAGQHIGRFLHRWDPQENAPMAFLFGQTAIVRWFSATSTDHCLQSLRASEKRGVTILHGVHGDFRKSSQALAFRRTAAYSGERSAMRRSR